MRLPDARGPLSAAVRRLLLDGSWAGQEEAVAFSVRAAEHSDPLHDIDFQSALASCYELHYRGFDDVDDQREWDPQVLSARIALESRFEKALRALAAAGPDVSPRPVEGALREMCEQNDIGPSLSDHVLKRATADEVLDFFVQRSLYHLKEGDPHTWVIPRIAGPAKAALIAIQADEYGNGRLEHMHATMFARAMTGVGLDDTYGAYWADALPETHASVNVISFFGLHRRHRGALVGHLAAVEMTSTVPSSRYANGLRRLGFGQEVTAFFDEHVEADAVHEQLACIDMCGSLARSEPDLQADILFGASCCLKLNEAAASALMAAWGVPGAVRVAS